MIPRIQASIIYCIAVVMLFGITISLTGCYRIKPVSLVDNPNQLILWNDEEYLNALEAYLPMLPDSIIDQYRHYDQNTFYMNYQKKISFVEQRIDSFNVFVGPYWSIDTLSIDHTMENFGTAALSGKTLYVSSSYFFMYTGTEVLRSMMTHEFGHIFYSRLTPYEKCLVNNTWTMLEMSALLYLFHEGEYSHNPRFGGHPEDSSAELFASAYNLFSN